MGLAEARKQRDRWAAVLAAGQDPIVARQAERNAASGAHDRIDPTFADMVDLTFQARKASLRGEGKRGRWLSPLALYMIPAIGKRRMSELHQRDVMDALAPIWTSKHPTAIKAYRRTKIVFQQARLMGVDCDPFTVDAAKHMLGDVAHKVRHHPETPWQDIPALYARLGGQTASHLCLRWCILTLARIFACRGARFAEINDGVWTVPVARVKGREGQVREFRVPLSAAAQGMADAAADASRNFLFPGARKGHLTDQALTKALRQLGETGTVHGFRTSFRTWVQDTDVCGYEVAETVLGHAIGSKVERSYARSDLLDRRRVVMEDWAAFVTGDRSASTHDQPALGGRIKKVQTHPEKDSIIRLWRTS